MITAEESQKLLDFLEKSPQGFFGYVSDLVIKYYDKGCSYERNKVATEIQNLEFDSGFETSFNKQYRQGKEDARNEIINLITKDNE